MWQSWVGKGPARSLLLTGPDLTTSTHICPVFHGLSAKSLHVKALRGTDKTHTPANQRARFHLYVQPKQLKGQEGHTLPILSAKSSPRPDNWAVTESQPARVGSPSLLLIQEERWPQCSSVWGQHGVAEGGSVSNAKMETRETALRVNALPEDRDEVPSNHMTAHNYLNFSSRASIVLF